MIKGKHLIIKIRKKYRLFLKGRFLLIKNMLKFGIN